MAQLPFLRSARPNPELRYMRSPRPLHFPESALMPETKTHLTLRTFLYQLLQFALGPAHSVGSDQFIYWNAASPQHCLAPDVFVKLGVPDRQFGTWKTWEEAGPPDVAVEIVSPSDGEQRPWQEKLDRYFECGIPEVVRFDPTAPPGQRVRVWDRVRDDLVERVISEDRTPCLALGFTWVVCAVENEPVGLRLEDHEGKLIATEREAAAHARASEAQAAQARIRELEAELERQRKT